MQIQDKSIDCSELTTFRREKQSEKSKLTKQNRRNSEPTKNVQWTFAKEEIGVRKNKPALEKW